MKMRRKLFDLTATKQDLLQSRSLVEVSLVLLFLLPKHKSWWFRSCLQKYFRHTGRKEVCLPNKPLPLSLPSLQSNSSLALILFTLQWWTSSGAKDSTTVLIVSDCGGNSTRVLRREDLTGFVVESWQQFHYDYKSATSLRNVTLK